MSKIQSDTEFRQFVKTMGPWFDGLAKFVAIMGRHNDDIYTGERLMLEKFERKTFKIDKYMKDLRTRIKAEDDELVAETVRTIQERILADERVGEALAMPTVDFWQQVLTQEERQVLYGLIEASMLMDRSLYEPFRSLFGSEGSAHRLNCLNDESMASRLFVAAVNDGVVAVIEGESVTPIVMDGISAKMIDAFSLAELVDTDVSFVVDIGGFQIQIE